MKGRLAAIGVLAILAAFAAAPADAGFTSDVFSADGLFFMDTYTRLNILDWEDFGTDLGTGQNSDGTDKAFGSLDEGDTLRGVIQIASAQDYYGNSHNLSGFELTGIFEVEVIKRTTGGGTGQAAYRFGPNAAFGTEVGYAGAMIALYEDIGPTTGLTFTNKGTAESTATDGTLYMVAGAGTTWGTDYHWNSKGDFAMATGGVSVFSASLDLIYTSSGLSFHPVIMQAPVAGFEALDGATGLGSILNEIAFMGSTALNPTYPVSHPYPVSSQDPTTLWATPEPVALVNLIGLGMMAVILFCGRNVMKNRSRK